MNSTINTILKRMQLSKAIRVFEPRDFLDLGSRAAVDQALSRLARSGKIRRISRGIYDLPRYSELLKAEMAPDAEAVAMAAARKTGSRIQPSGAAAANALGLSTQVPARPVYLTDGPSKRVSLGKRGSVELRHVPKSAMVGAGRIQGLVLQALVSLGRDGIDDWTIGKLRHALTAKDKKALQYDANFAAPWLRPYVALIVAD